MLPEQLVPTSSIKIILPSLQLTKQPLIIKSTPLKASAYKTISAQSTKHRYYDSPQHTTVVHSSESFKFFIKSAKNFTG